MSIGVIAFTAGVFVYRSTDNTANSQDLRAQVENAIELAVADGVLTNREIEKLSSLAQDAGLNPDEVIKKAEDLIASDMTDSETELVDRNRKNGEDFEKYIVTKFSQEYFTVKEWAGDKYVDGIFAENTQHPDILLELKTKSATAQVSVECKWRSSAFKGSVRFSYPEQLERYKRYELEKRTPVFIALGLGGKPQEPERLFIIPVKELEKPSLSLKKLAAFEKEIGTMFFFNAREQALK